MKFGKLLQRYSPLLILAVIQLVVVLVAPSKPPTATLVSGTDSGTNGDQTVVSQPTIGANPSASPGSPGAGGSGGGTGTGGTVAPGAIGQPTAPVDAGGVIVGSGSTKGTVSRCAGSQPAPFGYMPPCLQFAGANGGASMAGVTSSSIGWVWYENVVSPAVAAIGSSAGLSYTKDQLCEALGSYQRTLNKRWQFYGRQLTSIDGPGSYSGRAQGNNCHFPYFQGSGCADTDAKCWRADADVIVRMKPAMVVGSTETPDAFSDELAKHHVLVLAQAGGAADTRAYNAAHSPYTWDYQMSLDYLGEFGSRYVCQKLAGKPVNYAGQEVLTSGGLGKPPPTRKFAILYPRTSPDYGTPLASKWADAVSTCGGGKPLVLSYVPDASTLTQQMATVSAQLKQAKITTAYLFVDFITGIDLSNALNTQAWHPELVISGAFAIDDDLLAQLANQNSWKYAFGPSLTRYGVALQNTDAQRAYTDSGASGSPFGLATAMWPYFWTMGNMFQMAGPAPTIDAIRTGMFNMPMLGGDPDHPRKKWGLAPDLFDGGRDVREVYWCSTATSGRNNRRGAYIGVEGDKRYQYDQMDSTMRIFPHGTCN